MLQNVPKIKGPASRFISTSAVMRNSQQVFQSRMLASRMRSRFEGRRGQGLQSQALHESSTNMIGIESQFHHVGQPTFTASIHQGELSWVRANFAASMTHEEIEDVNGTLKTASSIETLEWAASAGPVAMISSFGAQAAILLHMANQVIPGIPVISVDTGYLPPETYHYMEELKEHLDLNLLVVNNTEWSPARMEAIHGKLWEMDNPDSHKLYGTMRKSEPLELALDALEPAPMLLLSGLRASQTAARANMPRVAQQPDGRLKVLPLLSMTDDDVDEYFERHNLPQHPLVAQGYVSIGDYHSSRALAPGESAADARKTRFGGKFEECGLHVTSHEPVAAKVDEPERVKSALEIIAPTPYSPVTGIATHLVKKRMEDGDMCGKCKDVQGKLEKEGLVDLIGGVSIADLNDPTSDGLTIAEHFDEKKAPFFVVKEVDQPWRVIYSFGQWKGAMKKAAKAMGN